MQASAAKNIQRSSRRVAALPAFEESVCSLRNEMSEELVRFSAMTGHTFNPIPKATQF